MSWTRGRLARCLETLLNDKGDNSGSQKKDNGKYKFQRSKKRIPPPAFARVLGHHGGGPSWKELFKLMEPGSTVELEDEEVASASVAARTWNKKNPNKLLFIGGHKGSFSLWMALHSSKREEP